jgi:2-polyprenyl-3-methyl-5-hydroxy-6-metoxy-1,4-benzoquinol methylase
MNLNKPPAKRNSEEESFHDAWASHEQVETIDVLKCNEACTSPELRFIHAQLGPIAGKRVLDIGCGLGEASVYFALQGADVTSLDLSQEMLNATEKLAAKYGVTLRTVKADTGNLIDVGDNYDVVYLGNLLHHVDVELTIASVKGLLLPGGVLISWDPMAYNPLINIYRRIATKVRTMDEHPLTVGDIKIFKKYFRTVKTRYFWFTTLLIFIWMAVMQRRSPNKERYWKKVVEESDKWAWIYGPLENLDTFILKMVPFLGPLCWNVVVIAKEPIE